MPVTLTDTHRQFLDRLTDSGSQRHNLAYALTHVLPESCFQFALDYQEYFLGAKGAGHNHQDWAGGYADHLDEIMAVAAADYLGKHLLRPLPFKLVDVFLVLYLHDIEKPFKHVSRDTPDTPYTALALNDPASLKDVVCEDYGIILSDDHINGLKYIHGENEERRADARLAGPLATLCHNADMWSARGWHDQPHSSKPLPNVVETVFANLSTLSHLPFEGTLAYQPTVEPFPDLISRTDKPGVYIYEGSKRPPRPEPVAIERTAPNESAPPLVFPFEGVTGIAFITTADDEVQLNELTTILGSLPTATPTQLVQKLEELDYNAYVVMDEFDTHEDHEGVYSDGCDRIAVTTAVGDALPDSIELVFVRNPYYHLESINFASEEDHEALYTMEDILRDRNYAPSEPAEVPGQMNVQQKLNFVKGLGWDIEKTRSQHPDAVFDFMLPCAQLYVQLTDKGLLVETDEAPKR